MPASHSSFSLEKGFLLSSFLGPKSQSFIESNQTFWGLKLAEHFSLCSISCFLFLVLHVGTPKTMQRFSLARRCRESLYLWDWGLALKNCWQDPLEGHWFFLNFRCRSILRCAQMVLVGSYGSFNMGCNSQRVPLRVRQEDFSISDYPNFMVIELGETYDLCRYNHGLYWKHWSNCKQKLRSFPCVQTCVSNLSFE